MIMKKRRWRTIFVEISNPKHTNYLRVGKYRGRSGARARHFHRKMLVRILSKRNKRTLCHRSRKRKVSSRSRLKTVANSREQS